MRAVQMYECTANVGFLMRCIDMMTRENGTSNLWESNKAAERCRSLVINEKAKKGGQMKPISACNRCSGPRISARLKFIHRNIHASKHLVHNCQAEVFSDFCCAVCPYLSRLLDHRTFVQ